LNRQHAYFRESEAITDLICASLSAVITITFPLLSTSRPTPEAVTSFSPFC
jgi:hypothetical protein